MPASGVTAVTMNVTVTNTPGRGLSHGLAVRSGPARGLDLNFSAGRDVANLVTVKLSGDGAVCLFSTATTDVLADVGGYSATLTPPYWKTALVS